MGSSRDLIIGIKQASAWGTPVACGAGDGLIVTRDALGYSRQVLKDDSAGQDFTRVADDGPIAVSKTLEGYLRYDGPDLLLAMVMGSAAAPALQGTASGAYLHALTLAADVEGIFATYATDRGGGRVDEIPSLKIAGITLEGQAGDVVGFSADCIGDMLNRNSDSGTNTTSTIASVTPRDRGNRVLMRQGVFRLNAQDGAALGGSDEVKPSAFSLALRRSLEGDLVAGADTITEPTSTDFPEITLSLSFPVYTSSLDALLADLLAGAEKKADIVFSGAVIGEGYTYQLKLELPRLKPTNFPDLETAQAAKIGPVEIQLLALEAEAAPTGMSITQPLGISVTNTRDTALLA